MSLDDDLARWEAGYLSREALIASYASSERNLAEPFEKNLERNLLPDVAPELALVKMLDLHEQLVDIGSEPVLYLESDWDQLRDSLPDRLPVRRVFGTGRLARPLIAASMVVGLTAGAAAASPTVREHMISVWHGIQHNIGLVDDPIQIHSRSPITGSPHAPGETSGGPHGTTGPGNSGGSPGHSGDNPGNGGGNSGDNPGNGSGNTGGGPGNSDGTTGGGNSGSPGNSDGTTGGGNSGSPGNSDGTPGGGNSGSGNGGNGGNDGDTNEGPGNSDGTPGGGTDGDSDEGPGNSDGTPGGGNSGGDSGEGPGNSDGTPGGGNSDENPGNGGGKPGRATGP